MEPSLRPATNFRWTVIIVCHLAAALLYGSWYFNQERVSNEHYSRILQYSDDAPIQLWKELDYAAFKTLNGSLKDRPATQKFWALTNHRAFDLVQMSLVALLYTVFVLRGNSREEKLKRVQAGFYMAACIIIGLQIFHFTLFFFNRFSPTMIPLEGAVRLSQMEGITWSVKDISARCFPGDHSTFLFLIAIFVFYNAGWRYGSVALILAILGVLPRLVGGAHWFTDVVVGGGAISLVVASWSLASPLQKIGLVLSRRPSLFLMRVFGKFIPALRPPGYIEIAESTLQNEK